ncbi:hypothetical protein CHISP_1258 [Chitinispirillum alkaliphilum]|nr:hypothetical protein CHISP_1258 [Chitinispirillum alkaliphilum]
MLFPPETVYLKECQRRILPEKEFVLLKKERNIESENVFTLICLSAMTLGLYIPLWFIFRKNELNRMQSEEKISSEIIICALILAGCSLTVWGLSFTPFLGQSTLYRPLRNLMYLFDVSLFVIITIQSFKAKRILSNHFDQRFSKKQPFSDIYTLVFQIFYLQYKINRYNEFKSLENTFNKFREQIVD